MSSWANLIGRWGHYTLREVYFRDDRQASNPKHYFFLTSGEDGTTPELDLIGEQALAARQAKKTETQVASINEKFNALLLENVKTNKRPRTDNSQEGQLYLQQVREFLN